MNDEQRKSSANSPHANNITEGLPPKGDAQDERSDFDLSPDIHATKATAMQVFFAWEKLRILYNVVLGLGLVCVVTGLKGGLDARFFLELLLVFFVVNAVVSIGPVVEGYLCWFGVPRMLARGVGVLAVSVGGFPILAMWLWK